MSVAKNYLREKELEEILHVVGDEKKEKTLKYQLEDWITKIGYACEKRTYWEYMRKVLQEIVFHNICKAAKVQKIDVNEMTLENNLTELRLFEILNIQMKSVEIWKKDLYGC